MSTRNIICLYGDIRKIFCGYSFLTTYDVLEAFLSVLEADISFNLNELSSLTLHSVYGCHFKG